MFGLVRPASYVVLRLASGSLKLLQILPNTTISIGKFGSFPSNALLDRPYNLTYELVTDSLEKKGSSRLRIVPAEELHSEFLDGGRSLPGRDVKDGRLSGDEESGYDSNGEAVLLRTNKETVDDSNRQRLTAEEIETLKQEGGGAGRDLIAELMRSHTALDQKTDFALAKYAQRKVRKFMRRFTVLPLDVPTLARYLMTERDPTRIMELREETLALICSWANVHWSEGEESYVADGVEGIRGCGRWLVVDDTGGFLTASVAERMKILHPADAESGGASAPSAVDEDLDDFDPQSSNQRQHRRPAMSATSNTITVVHTNNQPNLSMLRYFNFDPNKPNLNHPLYTHLKWLSWLQLLSPEEDTGYTEPEFVPEEVLRTWKPTKRSAYYRKRRRWNRVKAVVGETRAGGFNGLIVASTMAPTNVLNALVPLLRGGAPVVVYSPHLEPLVELADFYSTPRRTAFLTDPPDEKDLPNDDFPVNPTFLLAPTLQTARVQPWQCLPGRTHPLMMARGGAEGYMFVATRVLPAKGKVAARGKAKRRKVTHEPATSDGQVDNSTTSSQLDMACK